MIESRPFSTVGILTVIVLVTGSVSQGGSAAANKPGKAVYEQHCAACHGVNGDGNGPASVWLFPKPRNFSAGLFKIQSTPPGSPPTDEDLFQTARGGAWCCLTAG